MLTKKQLRAMSRELTSNPEDYMDSFRKNVQMYIDQREITISEVAEKADISESTLKSFLYGESRDCHLSNAVKLARVFGVSIDELVGSGTISSQTCDSLQCMRLLPENFTHFVRWAIHYHYDLLTNGDVTEHAIEVMTPEIGDSGNLKMTNDLIVMDISELNKTDVGPKVFMGIRMPGNMYAPRYYENDILLIANDRPARISEPVVVTVEDNMWILTRKEEIVDGRKQVNYYSIRDGGLRAHEHQVKMVIGYIAKVHRNNEI